MEENVFKINKADSLQQIFNNEISLNKWKAKEMINLISPVLSSTFSIENLSFYINEFYRAIIENEKLFELALLEEKKAYRPFFLSHYYYYEKADVSNVKINEKKEIKVLSKIVDVIFSNKDCLKWMKEKENIKIGLLLLIIVFFKKLSQKERDYLVNKVNETNVSSNRFGLFLVNKEVLSKEDLSLSVFENLNLEELNFFAKSATNIAKEKVKFAEKEFKESAFLYLLPSDYLRKIISSNKQAREIYEKEKESLYESNGYFKRKIDSEELFNFLYQEKIFEYFDKKREDEKYENLLFNGLVKLINYPVLSKETIDFFNLSEEIAFDKSYQFSGKLTYEEDVYLSLKNILVFPFIESTLSAKEKIAFLVERRVLISKAMELFFLSKDEDLRRLVTFQLLRNDEKNIKVRYMKNSLLKIYLVCRILNILPRLNKEINKEVLKEEEVLSKGEKSYFLQWLLIDNYLLDEIYYNFDSHFSMTKSMTILLRRANTNLAMSLLLSQIHLYCIDKSLNKEISTTLSCLKMVIDFMFREKLWRQESFVKAVKETILKSNLKLGKMVRNKDLPFYKQYFEEKMKQKDFKIERVEDMVALIKIATSKNSDRFLTLFDNNKKCP